jgi:alpha-beta hydrolase superfamily lysophospholipase
MRPKEYIWKSFDDLDYYFVSWEPEVKPVAVLALLHGLGDHCRRYDNWITQFSMNKIATVSFDYRGHGRSDGKRGVINDFDELTDDTKLLLGKAKELFPGIPVILYGHSMGGTISMSYCLQYEELPDLAIITSPWLKLKHPPSVILRLLIRVASRLFPKITFSTGLHSDDFSENSEFVMEKERDELLHNRISPRLFMEINKQYLQILKKIKTLNIPMLLMHGKDDPVTDVSGSWEVFNTSVENVSYKEWSDAKHHLHNFPGSNEVMDFIIKWIDARIVNRSEA